METFTPTRLALTISAAAALLAGCGGSQPIGTPGAMPQSFPTGESAQSRSLRSNSDDYKVPGALVYVTNSNPAYSSVTVYDAKSDNPNPIATISTDIFEPVGSCIDGDGTLYVANQTGSGPGWVSEYALGKTEPLRIITDGINTPSYCAIDGHGNLWVSNVGGPTVTEYLKGSTTPHATLSKGLTYPGGIAIDRGGSTYVANYSPPNVQVFPAGGTTPKRTITDGIVEPGGIALDRDGTLYVPNLVPCNIEEYRAGQSKPYRAITKGINAPTDLAFARNGWMYEVSGGNRHSTGPAPIILEFRPGSMKPSHRTISEGLKTPRGAAYYPALLPWRLRTDPGSARSA